MEKNDNFNIRLNDVVMNSAGNNANIWIWFNGETTETTETMTMEAGVVSDVPGDSTFSDLNIKIWSVTSTSSYLRSTTSITVEMETPDDDGVVDGDYVSLDLPYGWCGMSDGLYVSFLEENGDGVLAEI